MNLQILPLFKQAVLAIGGLRNCNFLGVGLSSAIVFLLPLGFI